MKLSELIDIDTKPVKREEALVLRTPQGSYMINKPYKTKACRDVDAHLGAMGGE